MGNSIGRALVCCLASAAASALYAGMITTAAAEARGPGGVLQICDTGLSSQSSSFCTASVNRNSTASSQASVGYRTASAYVEGYAYFRGNDAQASTAATYSETFNFNGGTGTGIATIWETLWSVGTGSLDTFSAKEQQLQLTQAFTYGTPFTVTLTALASSGFIGSYGDAGSLLVQRRLDSVSVMGGRNASLITSSAPEPATWVLGLIGVGLVLIAKSKLSPRHAAKDEEQPGE